MVNPLLLPIRQLNQVDPNKATGPESIVNFLNMIDPFQNITLFKTLFKTLPKHKSFL